MWPALSAAGYFMNRLADTSRFLEEPPVTNQNVSKKEP